VARIAPLIVFYDLDCGFCRWTLAMLLRRDADARLLPLPIQSPEGERMLAAIPLDERLRSAHVVAADGRVWSGGDVAAPIAAELGWPWRARVSRVLRLPLRGGYRLVAGNRSRLSRLMPEGARDAATVEIERHRRRASVAS
jgi:predicted DCC family thiol-disulfide oxidoreductase YuxK